MQFEISSKRIREMADRMSAAFPVRKDKALEMLAIALGYRNFDTLSGILKAESGEHPTSAPRLQEKQIELWMEMFSCSEWGESPRWARTRLTQAIVDELYALREECRTRDLAHVSAWQSPDDWDENAGHGSVFNMREWQLYVSRDSFWYRGVPKHASIAAETRAIRFEELDKVLTNKKEGANSSLSWIGGVLVKDASDARALFEDVLESRLEDASRDAVAEWVGLHYRVNFDAEPLENQHRWLERYLEAHAD